MSKSNSDLSRETPINSTTQPIQPTTQSINNNIPNNLPTNSSNSFYYPNRLRVTFDSGTELITKQSMKDETDINNILKQYKRTGIIQHINSQEPIYTDLPDPLDYQEALNMQMNADSAFSTLPSVVRAYFNNDPTALLVALNDPSQRDKLMELGIIRKPEQPQPPGNPANTPPTGGELVQHPDRL